MTVKAVLAAKGGDVVTIEPTADLEAAAKLLSARRIGAVLIVGPQRRIVGILSERDIVRAISARGKEALSENVGQVMTRDVVTCKEDETISSLMEKMTARKFRHMPVVSGNELIGIVSIGDIVKYRVEQIEKESDALREYIRTA